MGGASDLTFRMLFISQCGYVAIISFRGLIIARVVMHAYNFSTREGGISRVQKLAWATATPCLKTAKNNEIRFTKDAHQA